MKRLIFLAVAILVFFGFQNCGSIKKSVLVGSSSSSSSGGNQSSSSVDLFLVIGQSNMRGRGPSSQPATIFPDSGTAWEYGGVRGFDPLGQSPQLSVGQTGIPLDSCGAPCYWTSNYYSALLSFAKTWKDKTGRNSVFVVRAKGGTGLTVTGDGMGNGYWLDFTNSTVCVDSTNSSQCRALYKTAITDFKNAYDQAQTKWGIHSTFAILILGENDSYYNVSTKAFFQGLTTLSNQMDSDMVSSGRSSFSANLMVQTGYFDNTAAYSPIDSLIVHKGKVQAITAAQDQAGEGVSKLVMVSKSAKIFMSPCMNTSPGQTTNLPADCGSFDLIHYTTPMYEKLGVEMATYGAIFSQTNIKPLSAASCQSESSYCAPTVEIFRWSNVGSGGYDHTTSLDPTEFDAQASYSFKGVRYHLFQVTSAGRIPLYRKYNSTTGDHMESLSQNGDVGFQNEFLLGYCSASSTNMTSVGIHRLKLVNASGVTVDHVTSKSSIEIPLLLSAGYIDEGILCYTN